MVEYKQFPPKLKHGSGIEIEHDPRHLLLSFKREFTLEKISDLLEKADLVLAESNHKIDLESKRPMIVINHTNQRFWVMLKSGESISQKHLNIIQNELKNELEWIGPVYRFPNITGPAGLFCILPNVLLIKPKRNLDKKTKELLFEKIRQYGMKVIPEKSVYLSGYLYCIIRDIKENLAYQLLEILQKKEGDLIQEVRFENMPMVVPIIFEPNDPLYTQQWNMQQIQAGGPGTTGWDLYTGDGAVVICILDSGCDLTHPDLQFSTQGINLGSMSGDGRPSGRDPRPAAHGTSCAGIAAAIINNNSEVAGVAGNCRIMPIAFQNWTDAEAAAGINYAADNGARVISMSFGVYDNWGWDFNIIDPAIEHAFYDMGCVLCAATGNEDRGDVNRYPSTHPLVMAIGASDQVDNRKSPTSPEGEWWGSNYGPGVSVVAPGVLIPTTDRQGALGYNTAAGVAGDYYLSFNGTSSATPHVAGLAALIKSVCPTKSNIDIRNIIEQTAEKVGTVPYNEDINYLNGTRNQQMGYGRINVADALREAFLYLLACLI